MSKSRRETDIVDALYQEYVTAAGHRHPISPAELQTIITRTGISINVDRRSSPTAFDGIQIGRVIIINGNLDPSAQMSALAREWFYALAWSGAIAKPTDDEHENLAELFSERFDPSLKR